MEVVAHYLQTEAVNRVVVAEKDLFGRSSYNRYYYATFLLVRELLRALDPRWGELPHADYPKILTGSIKDTLKKGGVRARKASDWDLSDHCKQAMAAASELAKLMAQGSATRVTADYHPEIPVQFNPGERFTLNSIDITVAHQWPPRARVLTAVIASTWRQINA